MYSTSGDSRQRVGVPRCHPRPGLKTSETKELDCDPIRIRILGRLSFQKSNKLHHFPDTQDSKKCENPIFPEIPGSVDQPSLVGYPGPIQSTEDNNLLKKPRKWRN